MTQDINKIIQNLQTISTERYAQLEFNLAIVQEENERLKEQLKELEEKIDGDK